MSVPVTFTWLELSGSSTERGTERSAAWWKTPSTPATARRTTTASRRSPSTTSTSRAVRFSRRPVEKSSSTRTRSPRPTSASTRLEPMKPAPPVTRYRLLTVGRLYATEQGGRKRRRVCRPVGVPPSHRPARQLADDRGEASGRAGGAAFGAHRQAGPGARHEARPYHRRAEPALEPERREAEPLEHVVRGLAADQHEAARTLARERGERRAPERREHGSAALGRRRSGRDQGRYHPRGERAGRPRAGPLRAREARHLDRVYQPAVRGALELTARCRVRAAGHHEDPVAGQRDRACRTDGTPRLLGPEHAAERACESRRADQQERPPAQQERAPRALQVGVGLRVEHQHARARRTRPLDRRGQVAPDGRDVDHGGPPAPGCGERGGHARVADGMVRGAREGGLVDRDASDHLPPG